MPKFEFMLEFELRKEISKLQNKLNSLKKDLAARVAHENNPRNLPIYSHTAVLKLKNGKIKIVNAFSFSKEIVTVNGYGIPASLNKDSLHHKNGGTGYLSWEESFWTGGSDHSYSDTAIDKRLVFTKKGK